jgi:hypothetical protein
MILLVGCNNGDDRVVITNDVDSYSPLMSSIRGITLTPNFESKNSYKNLVYHWKTPEGEFIDLGNEIDNDGEPLTWSAIENDKVVNVNTPFDIELQVLDGDSMKILATAKVTITSTNGFYNIKK